MSALNENIHIEPRPTIADTIQLRNIQLPLPISPEAWHRPGKRQPCTASFRLSYSSSIASAEGDDVSRTIDYGKLFRQINRDLQHLGNEIEPGHALGDGIIGVDGTPLQDRLRGALGQDVRLAAGIMANCGLQILEETAVCIQIFSI